MDQFDSFYHQLDSEQLLKRHAPELVADARGILADDPDMRVAGVIATPDSREAGKIRAMLRLRLRASCSSGSSRAR